jgi:hypothetical protein
MMQPWYRASATLLALLLVGCSDGLDAPSGYDDQVFLCDAEASSEREARTEACRNAAACAGWVSFRGTLQAQPVRVSSELVSAHLDEIKEQDLGLVREALTINGNSPYFALRWVFSRLPPFEETPQALELPIGAANGENAVHSSLRLAGGGASVEFSAREGELRTSWTRQEHRGDAHVDLGSGNVIDGCFFARVSVEASR